MMNQKIDSRNDRDCLVKEITAKVMEAYWRGDRKGAQEIAAAYWRNVYVAAPNDLTHYDHIAGMISENV